MVALQTNVFSYFMASNPVIRSEVKVLIRKALVTTSSRRNDSHTPGMYPYICVRKHVLSCFALILEGVNTPVPVPSPPSRNTNKSLIKSYN